VAKEKSDTSKQKCAIDLLAVLHFFNSHNKLTHI